jgi:hypothetical protein
MIGGDGGGSTIRIHCYDDRGEVGDFRPADGSLRVYRRSVVPNRNAPARGQYSTLNRRLAVLYRDNAGNLKFWLEGAGVIDPGEHPAGWKLASKNKAQLSFGTEPPTDVVYRSSFNRIRSHIAAAPGTSREDLDFGLFVSNVLKDEERRQQLYRDPADQ